MKKLYNIVFIMFAVFVIVHAVWSEIDMINAIDEHNASLDEINAELTKIELVMMHDLLVKYDKIAKPDTLTLEEKVDIMSLMMTNFMTIYYDVGQGFAPEPHWNQWIEAIKEGVGSGKNEEEKE